MALPNPGPIAASKHHFTTILLSALIMSALIMGMMFLSPANAHGPTRQKVTETIIINAAPEKVWAIIQNFNDMSWHPAVEKTDGAPGNKIDDTRILHLKGGATIDEVLYKYSAEKMSYSYRITKVDVKVVPVTNYSSHLTVKPTEDGNALVEWRGAFYRGFPNNDPPAELNDEAAVKAVTGIYQGGLKALKEKIEQGS